MKNKTFWHCGKWTGRTWKTILIEMKYILFLCQQYIQIALFQSDSRQQWEKIAFFPLLIL